jgi:hypothetical protein
VAFEFYAKPFPEENFGFLITTAHENSLKSMFLLHRVSARPQKSAKFSPVFGGIFIADWQCIDLSRRKQIRFGSGACSAVC